MKSLRTILARAAGLGLLVLYPQRASAAPAPEADAPSPEADAPAPEADAPAPEADAPAPEADAPAPEADAPAPEADAPAPGDPGPAQTPAKQMVPAVQAKGGAQAESAAIDLGAQRKEDSADKLDKPHEQRHLPHVAMPTNNGTTPWIRFTTFVDYFGNNYDATSNNDDFVAVVNYLNFGSDTKRDKYSFSTMARIDTQTLINTKSQDMCDTDGDGNVTPNESSLCSFGDTYRIERIRFGLDTKHFKIAVGDVNVNFGRGLGLSVRKELDIGNDPTLKGAKVELRAKKVAIKGVAGVGNRQQSDYSTRQLLNDPGYAHGLCDSTPGLRSDPYGNRLWTSCSDLVTGTRVDAKLPAKIRVGTHYNFLWFGEKNADQFEAIHSVGGDFARANIGKHWDFFAGATGLMRNYHQRENFPDLVEDGIAVYTANTLRWGSTAILIEGKYYDNYVVGRDTDVQTVQYAKIPTLERQDQQIPAGANTAGGRFRIDHTFREKGLTIYTNVLSYAFATLNDKDMFSSAEGSMLYHGLVGFRWNNDEKGLSIKADGGYRWEGYNSSHGETVNPETPDDPDNFIPEPRYQRKLPQVRLFYNQVVGHRGGFTHSLNFNLDYRYETTYKAGAFNEWHRGNAIIGYGMAPYMAVSFIGGFSSEFCPLTGEPVLQDKDNVPLHRGCDANARDAGKPHLWPGVEIRYNFLTNSSLRLFGGRQVGGLLCVNGSCRVLPDFEGARVDLVFGF